MSVEPRAALDRLIEAFEAHLKVLAAGRDEDDPTFQKAQDILISAFETYDEALYDAFEIDTPFLVYDDDDIDEDDFDDEDAPEADDEPLVVGDIDVEIDDEDEADDGEETEAGDTPSQR